MKKKLNPWYIVYAFYGLLVLIWVTEFLIHKNKGCTINGWDALGQLSTGFWIFLILGAGVAGFITWYAIRKYKADGDTDTGSIQSLLAAAAFIIVISTLKAYDVKDNCGTTGTKGNPENQVPKDDGRVPAQDMLPK